MGELHVGCIMLRWAAVAAHGQPRRRGMLDMAVRWWSRPWVDGFSRKGVGSWVYIEIGERERGCTGFERVRGIVREWRREWVKERGNHGREWGKQVEDVR